MLSYFISVVFNMNRKIVLLIIAIIIIIAGVFVVFSSQNQQVKNNMTNNIKNNTTTDISNWTLSNDTQKDTQQSSSNKNINKDPEYNSDEYVQRWDSSQKDGDSWAYTHSQPTKTEDGHTYKRMYNPDTGENYWGYMY